MQNSGGGSPAETASAGETEGAGRLEGPGEFVAQPGSLLSISHLGQEATLTLATAVAEGRSAGSFDASCERLVAGIFFNQSLRTRLGVARACAALRASFVDLPPDRIYTPALGRSASPYSEESIADVVRVLQLHADCCAVRAYGPGHGVPPWGGDRLVREMARLSTVPLLNLETDSTHPIQGIADLATMLAKFGDVRGRRVVIAWGYSPEPKPIAVPSSALMAAAAAGMRVTVAAPPEFSLPEELIRHAQLWATDAGGEVVETSRLEDLEAPSAVIYMKSWLAHGEAGANHAQIAERYVGWRATSQLLKRASALYMHCLPADRRLEVDDDVIDGPLSLVWDQVRMRREVSKHVLIRALRTPDRTS